MRKIIASRHTGAIEFVRSERPDFVDAEVRESVTPDDVRGAHVIGNLPLHLAALCGRYEAIEFSGPPPRGAEYGLKEMRACGARLVEYRVHPVEQPAEKAALRQVAATARSNSPYAARISIRAPEGVRLPARGHWVDCGEVGRVHIIEFEPDPSASHLAVLVDGEVMDSRGYRRVFLFDGRHDAIELGLAEYGAVLRIRGGYKCRRESVVRVEEGELADADPAALSTVRRRLMPE
jgi:putative CRISPR-associated protein (TIGR02620 family)